MRGRPTEVVHAYKAVSNLRHVEAGLRRTWTKSPSAGDTRTWVLLG